MKYVHEILEDVEKAKTKKEKVSVLVENNCLTLRNILRGTFDPSVEFILPTGSPPYNPSVSNQSPRSLESQCAHLNKFIKGGPGQKMKSWQRENIFISMLEKVHPKDAAILIRMKDKDLEIKGLTLDVVKEAFPSLIKG